MDEEQRKAFEAWARTYLCMDGDFALAYTGKYAMGLVEAMWQSWKSALASSRPAA